MKLFSKYNRINIVVLVIIFTVGCTGFYFVLRYVLMQELDGALRTEQSEIISYVKEHDQLPEVISAYNQQISFIEIKAPLRTTTFSSLKKWDAKENQFEWVRQLSFGIAVSKKQYQATVSKSQMETEELLQLVIMIGAGMMALVLLAGYCINRIVIGRLWKPFYKTVEEISQYELAKQQALRLNTSDISEFDLLNQQLYRMTERAQHDYQVVKEFGANAAHEMQTPLAVIRSHTEALMQDERLVQVHNNAIQTIDQSVDRLTRLNQALLLLAKIDNRQFVLNEPVQLDGCIQRKTDELAELLSSQKITIVKELHPVKIFFNQHLADVLVNNLLYNALNYNVPGGKIIIQLNEKAFSIANSSSLPALDPDKISHRFYRHPQTVTPGNGLGLSIVKQLCELAGYHFHYHYQDGLHVFSVAFSKFQQI